MSLKKTLNITGYAWIIFGVASILIASGYVLIEILMSKYMPLPLKFFVIGVTFLALGIFFIKLTETT